MNSTEKLVAAAQRAARKLSRAEGVPYQTSLDRIAISVGRSTWSSFLADPVAVDQTAATAAAEPDFTLISPDAHLHAAIAYGGSIHARALLARPAIGSTPARLIYSSERAIDYDLPIDARGVSIQAMITAIATSAGARAGVVVLQDVKAAYEIDDLGNGEDMQLRLSFDENAPPANPVFQDDPDSGETTRRSRDARIRDAIIATPRMDEKLGEYDLLDHLIQLPAFSEGADIRVDPHGDTFDVVLCGGGLERIIRTGDIDEYRQMTAAMKDRGHMDQMETRYSQYGDWEEETGGRLQRVHVASEPLNRSYNETLRIGLVPFPKRNYVMPVWHDVAKGGCLPLGAYGLMHRIEQHAGENDIVIVSGRNGSRRTGRFVVPAIMEAYGNDVIVSDMPGTLPGRLGAAWSDRGPTLHLDPRAPRGHRSPAFNPFHPDMMPTNHIDAAVMVAGVLFTADDDASQWARYVFPGIVDLLQMAPHLRPTGYDAEQPVSLPMIVSWFDRHFGQLDEQIARVTGSAAIRAVSYLQALADCSQEQRESVADAMSAAFAFIRNDAMTRLLEPVMEDRGADVARALAIGRNPALIVVGGDHARGEGRLVAMVMESVSHLRRETTMRRTHFHVDDADLVGPMPWLAKALGSDYGAQHSTSVSVVLDRATCIDDLYPSDDRKVRIPGVKHWLIEEIREMEDRQRVADAMGVRASRISTHRPDGRRIHIHDGNVRLLRR